MKLLNHIPKTSHCCRLLSAFVLSFLASSVVSSGQAVLEISDFSGPAGAFELQDAITVSFTLANTTEAVEANEDDGITEDDARAANEANSAQLSEATARIRGFDIYGNLVNFEFAMDLPDNPIGPGGSATLSATVQIPNDGTLHNPDPGYLSSAEVVYTSPNAVSDSTVFAGSNSAMLILVTPNLILSDVEISPGTYRGGDILQFTVGITNFQPFTSLLQSRPLTTSDAYRTTLYLSDDASIDSNSDFRLGFFSASGSYLGIGGLGGSGSFVDLPGGEAIIRSVEVDNTPSTIDTFERDYSPQPADTFLDVGEELRVKVEVLVPRNFEGELFIGAYTDSLQQLTEVEEGVDATFGSQGDNILVDSLTPAVRIVSSNDPTLEPVSEVTDVNGQLVEQSDGTNDNPSVSEDGEWVVFDSYATNLDPEIPGNQNRQVYLRNTESREVTLISASQGGIAGNRDSRNPVISADGRFIAFQSSATNIIETQGGRPQIFIYDRRTESNTLLSTSALDIPGNAGCFRPSISEDGRFVAFESTATNLVPEFSQALGNTPAIQAYVVDRDVSNSGILDADGNRAVHLASVDASGNPADQDATSVRVSLAGDVLVFQSAASLDGTYADTAEQIWYREFDSTTGAPVSAPKLASVDGSGAPGKDDSSDPVVNEGFSSEYGLQIAFVSKADNLIPDDTNETPDIFVRDFSNPSKPVTTRVSVSNPRVATGRIQFVDPLAFPGTAPNRPSSNPEPGDTIKLSDGSNPAVTFQFVDVPTAINEIEIADTTPETRQNLIDAINLLADSGSLNFFAYASNPPPLPTLFSAFNGFGPGITIFNTLPGAQGNQEILVDSPNGLIRAEGMSNGGIEANDLERGTTPDPKGSLQPTIDRSGRVIGFRSLAGNLDVIRDEGRFQRATGEPRSPGVGEMIRPLKGVVSNVYLRDRDLSGVGLLDIPGNTDTLRASTNGFGYPTNSLFNVASTGSSRRPALSADGRALAFASDAGGSGGLRFGRTNTEPLDDNNFRDVFIFNRNTPTDIGGGSTIPAFVSPTEASSRIAPNGTSTAFIAETIGLEPIEFQWRKDGINLSDGLRVSGANTSELIISNLQPDDAGNYVLVAQNGFGATNSPVFELVIGSGGDQTGAFRIDSQPQASARPEGSGVSFAVGAVASQPISYQWQKDGVALSAGPGVSGVNSPQLQLSNLGASDAGSYQVELTAGGQVLTSDPAALTVASAPVILTQPQGFSVDVGGSGQLSVVASSLRTLSYQWIKDGSAIPGANAPVYQIESAGQIDSGAYAVRVSDDFGSQILSQTATVTVSGGGGSLPGPLQSASSLGGDWYHLPWFGSFASPGGAASAWIYRSDLGWMYVDPDAGAGSFWSWSESFSSWMWTSQSAAANGFYYNWSAADWMFILANPSGTGAWVKPSQSGDWFQVTP